MRFFDDHAVISKDPKYNPKTASLSAQLVQYQSEIYFLDKNSEKNDDGLLFWRNNHLRFHTLAKIVRRLFSYQATSVESERLFSAAGYTVWERRASLSPEKLDKIIMIQQYCHKLI